VKTPKDLKPLIDCDILRYRCGFAADSQMAKELREKNPGITQEELDLALEQTDYTAIALHNVRTVMDKIVERFNDEYRAYIDGPGNFRDKIATIKPYKGTRTERKPKYFREIKEYLIERWNAIEVHAIETDDAIGIEQYDNPDKYTVIVSTDKDMDTIPGWHYNWVKDNLYYQSLNEANLFLMWQMLVGDTADNVPGIDGIGPVKATKLLNDNDREFDRVRDAVRGLYAKQYGEDWERAYWEVGNLLYIRRKGNEEECPLL
jgi:hypothetical protein